MIVCDFASILFQEPSFYFLYQYLEAVRAGGPVVIHSVNKIGQNDKKEPCKHGITHGWILVGSRQERMSARGE